MAHFVLGWIATSHPPSSRIEHMRLFNISLIAALGLSACSDIGSTEDEARQLPYAEGSAEAIAVLAVANDLSIDVQLFDDDIGLDARAARNIVAHRDGADPDTTDDDDLFDDLRELFSVSYCKKSCIDRILEYARDNGYYSDNSDRLSVVFSPQAAEATHLVKIAEWIDLAQESIDIAMYSYSHSGPVRSALERALNRGITVRFLANSDLAKSSSKGGGLEEMGIDVRRVTKIMHHKFAIIDGARDDASIDKCKTARLISGSGNWSSSAGTIYDENTLFMNGYPELALRLQRDFDTLWAGSKDVVYQDYTWDQTRANITDEVIAEYEDPNTDVLLTSVNFKPTSSNGWSVLGTTAVSDGLGVAIRAAKSSIKIASGHFVSEPIAEAVVDALEANSELVVDIALDCQEATRSGTIRDLKNTIESLGGVFTYKCNTFRWHYKYAKQMHHKYMIVDDEVLYTGSYNMSKNAETNTFENMMILTGAEHAPLIASYLDNHAMVKAYGTENDGQPLVDLIDDIESGGSIPLTWTGPIAMSQAEFTDIKDRIREACPATKSWEDTGPARTYNKFFNSQPQWFAYCSRTGYPWPKVPENQRQ